MASLDAQATENMGQRAILLWLESLLRERVCTSLTLKPAGSLFRISCSEAEKGFIDIPIQEWGIGKQVKDCAFFDSASEGWPCPSGKPLPAPGVSHLPSRVIQKNGNGYMFHYDILGMAFWMLTRLEEIARTDLDGYARFPATASHGFAHGYLERPIVDEWFTILRSVATRIWPNLPVVEPQFRMRLSHDVDRPGRYALRPLQQLVRAIAGDSLKRASLLSAFHGPRIWLCSTNALSRRDPYNTFDWIMDRSDKLGLNSVFHFISGCTQSTYDGSYQIDHPALRHLLTRISERGHEIGLHPSYNTYRSAHLIITELDRLRRVCAEQGIKQNTWGSRMHYLRWETPTTLRALAKAGLTYDSTLGYPDKPGFRCGTCFDYQAFDPVERAPLPLHIHPLIAMECTVLGKNYLGLEPTDAARAHFLQLKHACRLVGGVFSLLWHNSELHTQEQRQLYETVLTN